MILGEWLEATATDASFQPEAKLFDEGLPMTMFPEAAFGGPAEWMSRRIVDNTPDQKMLDTWGLQNSAWPAKLYRTT